MTFFTEIIVILLMLVLNAVFAAYEMALASVSRARLLVLVNQKKKGAEAAAFMKDRMEASLAVIQLGITLFGAIAAATGGAGIEKSFAPFLMLTFGLSKLAAEIIALITLIIPLSCFIIIFAELLPKMFALNNREWVLLRLSPAMKALALLAYPVVRIFEYLVKKMGTFGAKKIRKQVIREELQELYELRAAVSLARAARLIGAHEEKIVLAAAHLSSRHLRDIMIPAADISMIPIEASLNDALVRAHLDLHTRFPVCSKEGDPQTIEGYINFKDIVLALKMSPRDPSVRGITRPITRVYSLTPIADVLSLMMQNKIHIALVTAREGKILGLITLEDILEELVGEIEDEFDRLSSQIQPYGNAWIAGGGVPMKILAKKLELADFPEDSPEGAMSLAEWCTKKLGRPPKGGETFNIANISVVVRKLRRRRLSEAIVSHT